MIPRHLLPSPATVPRLWPESTIVCLATGPSLTRDDCEYVRGKVDAAIAVNDAYKWAPWADVLYGCDAKWWYWHKGAEGFQGRKYAMQPQGKKWPGVDVLANTGAKGLELDPTGLRTGNNSGYQAINLAVHFGAKRIILLGYDMRGNHCFGHHPDNSRPPFHLCIERFKTLVGPLREAGVEVINCTPKSALDAFPIRPLADVLPARREQVA